ncbi:hypothetical protein ACFLTH_08490 [Bacteroidota bacterium]
MINIKKLAVIAAIAILFGIFIFSLINAIYESPDYSDFCRDEMKPQRVDVLVENPECADVDYPQEEADACLDEDAMFEPVYENGCVVDYKCETCYRDYDNAQKKHNFYTFVMSSILGLIAVFLSIYLPFKEDSLKEWLLTGFLIGGLAAVFIGTGQYFSDLHRILRPIIILIEIILVVFVAYSKITNKK